MTKLKTTQKLVKAVEATEEAKTEFAAGLDAESTDDKEAKSKKTVAKKKEETIEVGATNDSN